LSNVIRVIKLKGMRLDVDGPVAHMGKNRTLAHTPEGWRLLGRPEHRSKHNIKTDLKEREWDKMG
jgi:hypothetical protein